MTEIVISGWRTRCWTSFSHHSEARRTKAKAKYLSARMGSKRAVQAKLYMYLLAVSFVAALSAILQASTDLRCRFLRLDEHEVHDNDDGDPEEDLLVPKKDFSVLKEA